mmetsp:Transcript_6460/g.20108  ORF Transcript_6460/g.20108 Transcript_6460/m.20108 type:complete len:243 (+) Transcript_6460:2416-3144(+)
MHYAAQYARTRATQKSASATALRQPSRRGGVVPAGPPRHQRLERAGRVAKVAKVPRAQRAARQGSPRPRRCSLFRMAVCSPRQHLKSSHRSSTRHGRSMSQHWKQCWRRLCLRFVTRCLRAGAAGLCCCSTRSCQSCRGRGFRTCARTAPQCPARRACTRCSPRCPATPLLLFRRQLQRRRLMPTACRSSWIRAARQVTRHSQRSCRTPRRLSTHLARRCGKTSRTGQGFLARLDACLQTLS